MGNIVERTNYDIRWLLENVNHNCQQIGWEQLDLGVLLRIHNLTQSIMDNDYCSGLLMDYLNAHCSGCGEKLEEDDDEVMEV